MENKSDMKISGSGSISSGVYNDIKISGSGGILGDVDCNDIKISGSASCKGEIKVNNLKVSGSSSFYKDVEVKEFLKIMWTYWRRNYWAWKCKMWFSKRT